MPDQIRIKRELFGRVSDIEAIILSALQQLAAKKGKKVLKDARRPDFTPEIGFLKEDASFDIGVGLKKSTPEIITTIKTALEVKFQGKKVEVE